MGEKRKGNQSGNLSTVKMTATDEKRKSERDKGKDYGFSEDDPFLQVGDGVEERRDGEGSFASGGYRRNVTGFFSRGFRQPGVYDPVTSIIGIKELLVKEKTEPTCFLG